jgi:hypothetical protein
MQKRSLQNMALTLCVCVHLMGISTPATAETSKESAQRECNACIYRRTNIDLPDCLKNGGYDSGACSTQCRSAITTFCRGGCDNAGVKLEDRLKECGNK